jgi:hypothetical protein
MAINKKQIVILVVGALAIAAIVYLMPRYKMVRVDANNYIITEQSSPLFKRSQGELRLHWNWIAPSSGGVILLAGLGVFFLRDKRG